MNGGAGLPSPPIYQLGGSNELAARSTKGAERDCRGMSVKKMKTPKILLAQLTFCFLVDVELRENPNEDAKRRKVTL